MKKFIFVASASLLMLAGCSEEEILTNAENQNVITASFENGNNSRVAVGDDNMLRWSTGDRFVVLSETGSGYYALSGEGGSSTGTFTGTLPSGTIRGAAYPFVDVTIIPTLSGNTLTMTMPSEITFEEGSCDAPMWAAMTSNDVNSISFKHLASMLKVDLSGIPATAGQLIVDASAPIAGKFTADIAGSGDGLILAAGTDVTNSITVKFDASSSNTQRLFLIPIPAATYTSFALSYANADGSGKTFLKSWNNLTFKRAVPNKAEIAIGNIEADLNSDVSVNGDTYTIKTATGLFWFAEQVNDGNDFADKTVELGNDIDLNDVVWTPIGNLYKDESGKTKIRSFKGTFDGKEHTISNLKVELTDGAAGLFGAVENCLEIKNVKIQNANIVSNHYVGSLVGYFQENGSQRGNPKISSCSVADVTIEAVANENDFGDKAGAIVGYAASDVNIENCTVTNASITGYRDLGGIAGMANTGSAGTVTISGCTTSNVSIVQDLKNNYATNHPTTLGDVYGRGTATGEGNNAVEAGITVKAYNQNDAQGALDAANTPRTIELAAGNYGILYLRWNDASALLDDSSSPWAGGNHTYMRTIEGLTITGVSGTELTSLSAESGVYPENATHSLKSTHNYLRLYMSIKNLAVKNIKFTPEAGKPAVGLASSGRFTAIDGLEIENCTVEGTNCEGNVDGNRLFISENREGETAFGLDRVIKNITITGCTMNNLHQGIKIVYAENIEICNNTFNAIKGRDILLNGVKKDGEITASLKGKIFISGNTSKDAEQRFLRVAYLSGTLSITNNTITDYKGTDADIVKISDSCEGATVTFSGNSWSGETDEEAKSENMITSDK